MFKQPEPTTSLISRIKNQVQDSTFAETLSDPTTTNMQLATDVASDEEFMEDQNND